MDNFTIKSKKEIDQLREGGNILVKALLETVELTKQARGGKKISTWDLDQLARNILIKNKAEPSFLNYGEKNFPGFPGALCVSVNDEIVHGVPNKKKFIKKGDLVKLDLGVKFKNLFTDAAVTVLVGGDNNDKEKDKKKELLNVTKKSLELGLQQIYPGSTLGNYGNVVEKYAALKGFYVVRGLVGHGVGYAVHEPPQIPNFGSPGEGLVLQEGMVLALEPMVNEISSEIKQGFDGFTFLTKRGGLSAHFECTVAVTKKGYQVLTNWLDKI